MLLAFCKAVALTSGCTGEKGKGNTHRPMSLSNAEVAALPVTMQFWLQQFSAKEKQPNNIGVQSLLHPDHRPGSEMDQEPKQC